MNLPSLISTKCVPSTPKITNELTISFLIIKSSMLRKSWSKVGWFYNTLIVDSLNWGTQDQNHYSIVMVDQTSFINH